MVAIVTDYTNANCTPAIVKTIAETSNSVPQILHPLFANYEAYARVAVLLFGVFGNAVSLLVLSRFNHREHWILSYFSLFVVLETIMLFFGLFSWLKIGLQIASSKAWLDVYASHVLWCRVSHVLRWTLVFVLLWSLASCAVYRAYHTLNDDYKPRWGWTLLLVTLTGLAVNSPFLYAISVYENCHCLDDLFIFNHHLLIVLVVLDQICPMAIIIFANMANICFSTMHTHGRMRNALQIFGHGGKLSMKRKNEERYTTSFLTFSSLFTLITVPMLIMNLIYLKLGFETSRTTQNFRLLTMRLFEFQCACLFPFLCVILPQFWKETRHLFVNGLRSRRFVKSRNSIIIN